MRMTEVPFKSLKKVPPQNTPQITAQVPAPPPTDEKEKKKKSRKKTVTMKQSPVKQENQNRKRKKVQLQMATTSMPSTTTIVSSAPVMVTSVANATFNKDGKVLQAAQGNDFFSFYKFR